MRHVGTRMGLAAAFVMATASDASAARSAGSALEGYWEITYEIVDASNAQPSEPNIDRHIKSWIGHKYGSRNCVTKDSKSIILRSLYSWSPYNRPRFKIDSHGRFIARNTYFGGFAIPGRGTEYVVGLVRDGRIDGVADIDLQFFGPTHVRSVLTGHRIGSCP